MEPTTRPPRILPILIVSQFAGTSLWFASNAVLSDLQREWGLDPAAVSYITSSVQFGFITGTLAFAVFAIADRFSPRLVFFGCSVLGALTNLLVALLADGLMLLLLLRFLTGFCLAGIYPVGMKIAAGWYRTGLGQALGYLVGALVFGTAFPHLLRSIGAELPWTAVMITVSTIAAVGGALMLLMVPDGPYLPKGSPFNPRILGVIFKNKSFRSAVCGYFGHMWELYAWWAFVPVWLSAYNAVTRASLNVSLWSFAIIAVGFLGCAGGGVVSQRWGSAPVACAQLAISGLCCVVSPLLFGTPTWLFLGFLLLWGVAVVGDSPQFSTLNAQTAPPDYVGSALTIATSIGFFVTIFSIQLLAALLPIVGASMIFWLLIPGPIFGLLSLKPLLTRAETSGSPYEQHPSLTAQSG